MTISKQDKHEIVEGLLRIIEMIEKHKEMIKNYISDSTNTQLEDLPGEIWKDIEGFEDHYQISNKGRVKSIKFWSGKGKRWFYRDLILHPSEWKNYYRVTLCKDNHLHFLAVHRLVAIHFVPISQELLDQGDTYDTLQVNHMDENPKNNHAENLEWCTHEYNYSYGSSILRRSNSTFKPISQFDLNGKFITTYPSITCACKVNNIEVSNLITAIRYRHGYFKNSIWKYTKPEYREGYILPKNELINNTK